MHYGLGWFIGKRVDDNVWIEGFYSIDPYANKHYISRWYYASYAELESFEVIPESVGEFTGLTDIKGHKIFEGHIITNGVMRACVEFHNGRFTPFNGEPDMFIANESKIIGYMYDNPELLKGGAE